MSPINVFARSYHFRAVKILNFFSFKKWVNAKQVGAIFRNYIIRWNMPKSTNVSLIFLRQRVPFQSYNNFICCTFNSRSRSRSAIRNCTIRQHMSKSANVLFIVFRQRLPFQRYYNFNFLIFDFQKVDQGRRVQLSQFHSLMENASL